MPNCDFYAAGNDYQLIIEFILKETSCRIFELSSKPNAPLREFHSFEELESAKGGEFLWPPLLDMWPMSANPNLRIKHTDHPPYKGKPAWSREELDGWGTIQLYLANARDGRLSRSHTNHNSEKRALAWATTYSSKPSPATWDFKEVTRQSSKINRFIRRHAVSKRGSRVVLPGAQLLLESGVEFSLN
jgi:hypothetical protein